MAFVKSNDLQAFLVVAQEQSFTKAAARLGVTPSALSHSMRLLEERLGIRLLARTTRNVSPTQAGERLMHSIGPHFAAIGASIEALGELRDTPTGTLRISCTDDSIEMIIRPRLASFLATYPDITLEFYVDYGFTNVVEQRFDAGIRLGEALSKDMIAFVLLGMCAYLTGVTQAPLTSAVISLELTDSGDLLLPILATVLIARGVSGLVCRVPIYRGLAELLMVPRAPDVAGGTDPGART